MGVRHQRRVTYTHTHKHEGATAFSFSLFSLSSASDVVSRAEDEPRYTALPFDAKDE